MTGDQPAGIGSSAVFLTVARLSSAASLFAVTVLAARVLTADDIGSAAVGQIIGTFAALLTNGGINISTIYFLRRRRAEQASLVSRLVPLAIASSAGAFVLTLIAAPIVFALVLDKPDWALLLSAALLGTTIIGYEFIGSLLLGIGEPRRFVLLEVIRGWGSLAAVAMLLVLIPDSHALVLGIAAGFVLASSLGVIRAATRLSLRPRYDPTLTREALGFGIRGQLGNILQFLGVRLDLLIVPALLDLQQAGVYFIAVRVSDLVGQAATAASSFLFPHVAGQEDVRDTSLTERVTRSTLLVTLIGAAALAILAQPLLGIVFGEVYAGGSLALLLLLAGVIPLSVGRLIAADLKGRGNAGIVSTAALISLVATVIGDLALIPPWGIVGAAVSSLLAYSLMAGTLLMTYRAATGGMVASLIPRRADLRDLRSLVDRRVPRRRSTDR